ncbi:cytochrome P450 [Candidatus Protofrankia californiensis]|uniref:cytochrome P450 n=1 Tax=Candidatus Protofrankia californiensis TaxID=1839754 RepID=UPI0010415DF1|nr:cytochrome P450 [Candidatus Protofrankia californiensis]
MTVTPPATVTPAPAPMRANAVPGSAGGLRAVGRLLRADPLAGLIRLRQTHGPIVQLSSRPLSAFLVADPAAIADVLVGSSRAYRRGFVRRGLGSRQTVVQPLTLVLGQGLLTSSGDLHRRQRRLMQPLFHHQRIFEYGETFVAIADERTKRWQDGQRLDMHNEMIEMTLAMVTKTLFDVDVDADADSNIVTVIRTAISENTVAARKALHTGFELLEQLPLPSVRRRRSSRQALDRVVYNLIERRRRDGAEGGDLLSLLLSARDADTGDGMDDTQVRDEVLTIMLAGHETTANALTWTFHLLGRHPEVAAALHAELDTVLSGRRPTVADLPHLPFTDAVFKESMRLYPPVWAMSRYLVEDRIVGGYPLPAGSTLLLSQWVVHRDGKWWPEPERFDPSRWIGDRVDPDRPRYAYFPFGGGPHQCIGNSFAQTEGALALATISRRWMFEPVAGLQITPEPLVTLRPRDGLPMTIRRRG